MTESNLNAPPALITGDSETVTEFRKIENLHVFLWLFKDMCWCFDFKLIGMIMVAPTILAALIITWIQRKQPVELVHNIAVSLWICANTTWMTGEFYFNDQTRPIALCFFVSGIVILTIFYARVWISKTMKNRLISR